MTPSRASQGLSSPCDTWLFSVNWGGGWDNHWAKGTDRITNFHKWLCTRAPWKLDTDLYLSDLKRNQIHTQQRDRKEEGPQIEQRTRLCNWGSKIPREKSSREEVSFDFEQMSMWLHGRSLKRNRLDWQIKASASRTKVQVIKGRDREQSRHSEPNAHREAGVGEAQCRPWGDVGQISF